MGLGRFLVPGPNSGARTQIHASAYPDRTVLLMYGAQFSAAIDFPKCLSWLDGSASALIGVELASQSTRGAPVSSSVLSPETMKGK